MSYSLPCLLIHSLKLTEYLLLHARKDTKVAWPKVAAVDVQKNRWTKEVEFDRPLQRTECGEERQGAVRTILFLGLFWR